MAQAKTGNTRPDPSAQFKTRGYVIDEDADHALKDIANGLMAVAALCEERSDDMPEIAPAHWAGLLKTFGRAAQQIYDHAAFANEAVACKRNGS